MDQMNNQPPEVNNQPGGYSQQPAPQQGYAQPVYTPLTPEQQSARNLGIAGMVLGIVALVFCWFFYLSIPCGIVGLILSIIAIRKGTKGMAVAGLVCSIIALVIAIIIVIIAIAAFATVTNYLY